MGVKLIAVTSSSGLPLFIRHVHDAGSVDKSSVVHNEDCSDVSLNTVATLYSINLFSKLNGCEVTDCKSKYGLTKVHWKSFEEPPITLIIVVQDLILIEKDDVQAFLDLISDAIVMVCGLTQLSSIDHERLRQTLGTALPVVDYLLESFVCDRLNKIDVLTHYTSYVFTNRSTFVNSIVNSGHNGYCSLFAHGKLLTASKQWWLQLNSSTDSFLVACFLNTLSGRDASSNREYQIYLPHTSPSVPYRLVLSIISSDIVLCILCENTLDIVDIQADVLAALCDSKLQENKLATYIFGTQNTTNLPESIIKSLFPKNPSILQQLSSFFFLNHKLKVYFVHNETNLVDHLDEVLALCGLNVNTTNSGEKHYIDNRIGMYRQANSLFCICALFTSQTVSVASMKKTTNTLSEIICKAKNLWP